MSIINTITAMRSTIMANNAAFGWMNAANTRMGLAASAGNPANVSFGSSANLVAMDTQLELDMITNSFEYKMAKAMLEQAEKQEKEDRQRFNRLA